MNNTDSKKKEKVVVTVSKGPLMVQVPSVIKSSLFSAEITLSNVGLTHDESRIYNSVVPSGDVIDQSPAANEEVVQGSTVKLIVSDGPEPIWIGMPELTEKNLSEAKTVLASNKLTLGVVQLEVSYKYTKDAVIRQDPGAGTEVLQGSTVNLVVSSGPGPVSETASVEMNLTKSGIVRIVVDDEKSRNVAYEDYHFSGDKLKKTINYNGKGIIEVYLDNQLIKKLAVG
jgi:serine/threonine-protein kinase